MAHEKSSLQPAAARKPRILIVEDQRAWHEALRVLLEGKGYETEHVYDAKGWLDTRVELRWDAAVVDLKLLDVSGLDVLERMRRLDPAFPVIILSGCGTIEDAVSCMKRGAFDYVQKGVRTEATLLTALSQALSQSLSRSPDPASAQLHGLLGCSLPMRSVFEKIRLLAGKECTILIEGETGTGKERVAEAIHAESKRRSMVKLNCAALPADLFESELFGHERGAFSGAVCRQEGHLQRSRGGTLFLDEISELDLRLQGKLLRVVENKEAQPLGGVDPIRVDVRLLAATNQNIEEAVRQGKIREDLYYRLKTFRIWIPPLRERPEDILPLARHFLLAFGSNEDPPILRFSPEAAAHLLTCAWPGNVRELQSVVHNAVTMARGPTLTKQEILQALEFSEGHAGYLRAVGPLKAIEREAIFKALDVSGGNKKEASFVLGINKATIHRKLRALKEPNRAVPGRAE